MNIGLSNKVDSTVAMIMGSLVTMTFFFSILILSYQTFFEEAVLPISRSAQFLLLLLLLLATFSEWWFITISLRSLVRKQHPLGLTVAILQPRLPLLFRPLISLWWVIHALFCLLLGVITLFVVPSASKLCQYFVMILTGGGAYVTYVFVLLSVTALTKSPSILARAWKLRAWWGGLVFLATLLFHLYGPSILDY